MSKLFKLYVHYVQFIVCQIHFNTTIKTMRKASTLADCVTESGYLTCLKFTLLINDNNNRVLCIFKVTVKINIR